MVHKQLFNDIFPPRARWGQTLLTLAGFALIVRSNFFVEKTP